jgi:hypothetical protein
MTSIVRTILRGGASAARMRGKLRAVTHPVRRARPARAVATLGGVSGTLPATVLGNDLIRLMSGPLQRALSITRAVATGARAPRQTAEFHSANALHTAKDVRHVSPALRTSDWWRLPWGALEVAALTDAAVFAEPVSSRERTARRRGVRELHPAIGSTGRSERSMAFDGARTAPSRAIFTSANANLARLPNGAVNANPNPYDRGRVPALTAKLREYWQLTCSEQAQRARATDASIPSGAQMSTRGLDQSVAPSARPGEEHQAAQSVEQGLARFASGRLPSEANASRGRSSLSSVTSPAGSADLNRRADLNSARPGLLTTAEPSWDLPERLADILREQALQHGIDLT